MIIPVGLIARLVGAAVDSRDELAALRDESDRRAGAFDSELFMQRGRAHELYVACTGPTGCLLVLADNDWANTEIDCVRLSGVASAAPAGAGYRETADPLGAGPHGLVAVCPGRHAIRTTVDGQSIDADVILLPGEAMFRRLDRVSRTWAVYDAATEAQLLARVAAQQLTLLHYWEHVADPRMKALIGKSANEAIALSTGHLNAALEAIVNGDQETAMQRVSLASRTLVGAPVRSFAPITSFLGFNAFELFANGKPHEAWLLLQAGLAVLPDDPTLLAALGEIQLRKGSTEEGKAILRRALERQRGLEPAMHARVTELLG